MKKYLGLVVLLCACTSNSNAPGEDADAGDGRDSGTVQNGDGGSLWDGSVSFPGDDGGIPSGPVFYVATDGDDSNPGSMAAPWKSIQHAMSPAGGVPVGATVMVRGGVYSEVVSVEVSGASGSPIVLRSYPGERGIIDGSGKPVTGQQGLITISSQSYIIVAGLEIRNFTSTSSAVPVGVYVDGDSQGIVLLGNHVHHIITMNESCNGAGGNALGIAVYGNDSNAISDLIIRSNELDGLRTGCSESMSINGNVDGWEVSDNLIHDNDNIGIDAIGAEGTGPTAATDIARNGIIRHNTVFNITSADNGAYGGGLGADGIYVDGGHSILIEQNTVHHCDIGMEITSESSGHTASYVLARNNVIHHSHAGISIGGYDAQRGGTDHAMIVNNTLHENGTEFSIQFYTSTNFFQNNVLFDGAGNFVDGSTGVTIDHNLELSSGAASVFLAPGSSNASDPVDLHIAATTLPSTTNQGIALTCPAGWTCPVTWGAALQGLVDADGSPRLVGGAVDLGAYESP